MTRTGMDLERPTHMTAGFDYSNLSPEVARQARDRATHIKRSIGRNICEVGDHLRAMKKLLPHGTFAVWCKKELNFSRRSAQNYMAASEWLEDKNAMLALLPPTVVYALVAPSAPAEVVREVVAAAAAGALPKPEVILQKLDAARAEERAVKQEMAKKSGRSEDDARRRVSQKREARARKDDKWRKEIEQANAECKARRGRQHAAAQRLVAANREVVAAVVEAAEGDTHGLMAALKAALADSGP